MKLTIIEIALLAGAVHAQADFNFADSYEENRSFFMEGDHGQLSHPYNPSMAHQQFWP
jgi:hypothetical protein